MLVFLSHSWDCDELGRLTHDRVIKLTRCLRVLGLSVWIDEEQMVGDIDECMTRGIDDSDVVVFCLTHSYFEKLKRPSNVLKEWSYTHFRKKKFIPVIMEPSLLLHENWPHGIVGMYAGRYLYVDASQDKNIYRTAYQIASQVKRMGTATSILRNNKPTKRLKKIVKV